MNNIPTATDNAHFCSIVAEIYNARLPHMGLFHNKATLQDVQEMVSYAVNPTVSAKYAPDASSKSKPFTTFKAINVNTIISIAKEVCAVAGDICPIINASNV